MIRTQREASIEGASAIARLSAINRISAITRISAAALLVAGQAASARPVATAYDVVGKDIATLQADETAGKVSAAGLVDAYLARIAALDRSGPSLHAIIAVNPEARAAARALDAERAAGHVRGPLHGIPLLIKDNIETADPVATTAGSLALKDNVTRRDAPLVAKLRAAGAIVLGKTNLSEWANVRSNFSVSGWSAVGGQVRNPYALNRSACGSSSGSGAAVAAGFAPAAIGTETDGSITCPASINGLVGLKPTVGMVSRTHVVPISHSQDTPGPMTHTVADARLLLQAMSGSDAADPATHDADRHQANAGAAGTAAKLSGLRIGVLRGGVTLPGVVDAFERALTKLRASGAVLVELRPPADAEQMGEAESTVLHCELKADLATYLASLPGTPPVRTLADVIAFDRAHANEEMKVFGQDIFEKADACGGLDDPGYLAARARALAIARDGLDAMLAQDSIAFIVAPTMGPAFPIDGINGDASNGSGPGSLPAIAGYPHLTLPMGMVKGLPVGLSLIAGGWRDFELLDAGMAIENALGPTVTPPTYARELNGGL